MKKPLVSFILPNYNNQHVLDLFFSKFLENNTYDNYEFIITDDGSEDDGLDVLYKWQKSGKIKNMIIFPEKHKGIINALNKCLFNAKGDFIIRCDGDATIETKSFVEKFLEFYYINPEKIGVITSKVMTDDNNMPLHAIGRSVIQKEGLVDRGKIPNEEIGKRIWDFDTKLVDNIDELMDKPAEVDTALGVFTFCDRETALKIGGFDKNYPIWIEDDDFYLSFRLHNKKCFYLPEIEILHRFSLRGDRNPNNWSSQKRLSNRLKRLIYNKKRKGEYTIINILGIPTIKYCDNGSFRTLYLFNLRLLAYKYNWRLNILQHDYKYWKKKWGFDILNPDIEEIKKLYKNTEILWNYDENLKSIGEDIIKKYKKQ